MKTVFSIVVAVMFFCALPVQTWAGDGGMNQVTTTLQTTHLGRVEFESEPLADVLVYLSDVTGLNFILTDELSEEEIELDLSLNAGMTVHQFLRVVSDIKDIHFYLRDSVIMVARTSDRMIEPVLRVYNVSDLQFKTRDFPGPELQLGDDEGSGFIVEFPDLDESSQMDIDEVADMIEDFVGGDSWNNDERVRMEIHGGSLFVIQTEEVHAEISRLLQMLQGAR